MSGKPINIGSIYADLNVSSGNMTRGIAEAEKAIIGIEREIHRLHELSRLSPTMAPQLAPQIARLETQMAALADRSATAYDALSRTTNAVDILNAKNHVAANSTNRVGQGLMQLGYIADDAQYGLQGVINNIAPLVYGFTGNAGLAAAAQVAAVGANLLYKQWDQVKGIFGDTTEFQQSIRTLEGLTKAIKTLKDDAKGLSVSEYPAWLMGLNPDMGKAATVSGMEGRERAMKMADAEAKSMAKDESHSEVEEALAESFRQSVRESGGSDKLAERLANARYNGERDRGDLGKHLAVATTAGGMGDSEREEYGKLRQQIEEYKKLQVKEGKALYPDLNATDARVSRLHDLEETARRNSVTSARLEIGGAAYSKDDRDRIARDIGGETGEVLSGRKENHKDEKKHDKLWAKDAEDADKAERKRVSEEIRIDKLWENDAKQVDASEKKRLDLIDDLNKQGIEGTADWNKERDEAMKAAHKEAYKKAQDAIPNLDRVTEHLGIAQMWGLMSRDDAALALNRRMREAVDENGKPIMNGDEAVWATHQALKEGDKAARERMDDMNYKNGRDGNRAAKSEVYGVSELTQRIQSEISNKPTAHETKMEKLTEDIQTSLNTIAGRPFLNPRANP